MITLRELRPGQQIQTPQGPMAVERVEPFACDHFTLTLQDGSAMVPLPGSTTFKVVGAQLLITQPEPLHRLHGESTDDL